MAGIVLLVQNGGCLRKRRAGLMVLAAECTAREIRRRTVADNSQAEEMISLLLYNSLSSTRVEGRLGNQWRNRGHGMECYDRLRHQEVLFKRMYRLSVVDFDSVLLRIQDTLTVRRHDNAVRSSGSVVHPITQLCMALRFLSGGSYLDISLLYGVDTKTFYT